MEKGGSQKTELIAAAEKEEAKQRKLKSIAIIKQIWKNLRKML